MNTEQPQSDSFSAPPIPRSSDLPIPWLSRLDVAGAFGDIGVLFPIAIALITLNHLNPTALFLTAGLTYCLAARYFQIPIAVQPFKAVAAIALALSLSPSEVASAGLLMGALLLFVGVTDLAGWLAKLFTLPIVRGIQLGLGLVLLREGLRLVMGSRGGLLLPGGELTAWLVALGGAALLLALRDSKRFPAALVLLISGFILGVVFQGGKLPPLSFSPVPLQLLHPRLAELKRVLPLLVVPQFALTFGNSIVATEDTARILYGKQRATRHRARPQHEHRHLESGERGDSGRATVSWIGRDHCALSLRRAHSQVKLRHRRRLHPAGAFRLRPPWDCCI